MPLRAGNKPSLCSKNVSASGEASGANETRAANIKKKLMKNKLSGEAAAPANADQLSSNRAERVTKYNYNRELPTQKVLEFLRAPAATAIRTERKLTGKWIWPGFPKTKSNRAAANTLHRLGFH